MKNLMMFLMMVCAAAFYTAAQDAQGPGPGETPEAAQQPDTEQESEAAQGEAQAAGDQTGPNVRLSELTGYPLLNNASQEIGSVEDYVVTSDGRIAYAVIELDEIDTEEPVIVPIAALRISADPDARAAVLNADLTRLEGGGAPMLENGGLPAGWEQQASSFWSDAPAVDGGAAPIDRAYLASGILDFDVVNTQNEGIGRVDDLMVDLGNRRVAYVAVSVGGFLGLGDELFAVPMNDFQINETESVLTLDVSREVIEEAEGFDQENWPVEADTSWRSNAQQQRQDEALGAGEPETGTDAEAENEGDNALELDEGDQFENELRGEDWQSGGVGDTPQPQQ